MKMDEVINTLARVAHDVAVEKGWYERPRDVPELLMLVVSELSECLEAARKGNPDSLKIPPHTAIEEELADAVIRILDMASHLKLDLGGAILAKMRFNRTRERRHGGKVY